MESVKDLTEKLKNLDLENYNVRCYGEESLETSGKRYYEILIKPHCIDEDFHIKICLYEDGISVKITDVKSLFFGYPYLKLFKKKTYSKKEEAELMIVLEEIKEHSDASVLNKFNSFLK